MSGTVFLPCWLVGLSFPTLDPKGYIGRDWALVPVNTPQHPCHQCPFPTVSYRFPSPPQETLQDQQVGLAQGPMRSLLFQLGPRAHKTCVSSGAFVSPSPMTFLWSSPAGLQSQMLWGLICLMPDPQPEEPDMGSELTLRVHGRTSVILLFSSFWVIHPSGHSSIRVQGLIASLLQSCCGLFFVFGSWTSLLVGSGSGLLMVVQYSVVILVFSWEEVSSGPSVPPSCQEIKKLLIFKLSFLLGFLCLPMWKKACFYNKEMLHLYTAYILFKL